MQGAVHTLYYYYKEGRKGGRKKKLLKPEPLHNAGFRSYVETCVMFAACPLGGLLFVNRSPKQMHTLDTQHFLGSSAIHPHTRAVPVLRLSRIGSIGPIAWRLSFAKNLSSKQLHTQRCRVLCVWIRLDEIELQTYTHTDADTAIVARFE